MSSVRQCTVANFPSGGTPPIVAFIVSVGHNAWPTCRHPALISRMFLRMEIGEQTHHRADIDLLGPLRRQPVAPSPTLASPLCVISSR